MANRMPLLRSPWYFAAAALALAPALAAPLSACDQDSVFDVRILPTQVVVIDGRPKSVAAVVGCRARYDQAAGSWFTVRLVDVDVEVGEVQAHATPSGDDVLGADSITAADPGTTDPVPIAAGRIFRLRCDSSGFYVDGTQQEGTTTNPADLALHITDGDNFFRAAPGGVPVPARCSPSSSVARAVALFYTRLEGIPRFPELPPSMDLGYGAKFQATSGGQHLQFITAAGGPLPETVNVNVLSGVPLNASARRDQSVPQTIAITGGGPFVGVSGTVAADGVIEATGQGSVAGFPNINVTLTGTLRGGALEAEYSMGTGGQLPGGFPIVFELTGTSPDFTAFWDATAEALTGFADEMAQFVLPAPTGGVDFEDALTRQAANVTIAALGFEYLPQSGISEAAFSGVGGNLDALADEVAASSLLGSGASEMALREAANALRTAGEQFGSLRLQPPGAALNAALAEWFGSLGQFQQSMVAGAQAVFGSDYLAAVPAASFAPGPLAIDSIASGFGAVGAPFAIAESLPLPTTLGGLSLQLTDRDGVEHSLGLFFSSEGQLNYLMPRQAAEGPALLVAFAGETVLAAGAVQVTRVAPSLFTANANGEGVPAAQVLRVDADGSQTFVNAFTGSAGAYEPALIDLSDDASQYFLLLYGSGFRHASEVVVRIDGEIAPGVAFAPSSQFVGLDQANVPLTLALRGKGMVDLILEADGVLGNTVQIGFE